MWASRTGQGLAPVPPGNRTGMGEPVPFDVDVPAAVLDDLDHRLARTRWPRVVSPQTWQDGVDQRFLHRLAARWRDGFDWRSRERALNRHPQFRVDIDGTVVHFLHIRGAGPAPMPLLLTHGWPSTCWEFLPVISRLTDPLRHGGRQADAFDVVIPSLPGYLYSDPIADAARIPSIWHRLMTDVLGYRHYGAHGGDIGAMVTNRLAIEHPGLVGIHVTMPAEPAADPASLTEEERAFLAGRLVSRETGGAYAHVQRTRPDTAAMALNDSPVGLAAWILDKWHDWSDCHGDLESRFSLDDLLTTITLYWVTGTIGTSFSVYRDWALGSSGQPEAWAHRDDVPPGVDSKPLSAGCRITTPAAVALFEHPAPLSWARRAYADVRSCRRMPRGGHFPALEEPGLLVDDIQTLFRPLRDP